MSRDSSLILQTLAQFQEGTLIDWARPSDPQSRVWFATVWSTSRVGAANSYTARKRPRNYSGTGFLGLQLLGGVTP